jgi:anti-anti-sigma regulatory factor
MAIDVRAHRSGRTELVLHGSFDAGEAHRLHALLSDLAPGGPVRVDFHEVRLFDDFAIALLSRDLSTAFASNISLVGLSEHHHRLLRYMGSPPPSREP